MIDAVWFEVMVLICIGMGLSASCGFRVFVPLLVIAVASRGGVLTLAEGFDWLATWPAIGALALATVLEIAAFYVPWLDNLLDTISAPAAVIAGVIASAACVRDIDPLLHWSLAVIAGGGVAGAIKVGFMGLRAASTAATAGLGNPVISTLEWVGSLALSVLAIVLPILAAAVALVIVVMLARFALRLVAWRRRAATPVGEP